MLNFEFECVALKVLAPTDYFGRFVFQPLAVGQGLTIGNILRRVLLTNLSGLGILGVRIGGINDQFSILSGVREDVLEILLNLKEIVFKGQEQSHTIIRFKVQGPAVVTASCFQLGPSLEIVNPDQYIATISDTSIFEMEVKIGWGQGYNLAENLPFQNSDDYLQVDAVFMPVKKVVYHIQTSFSESFGSQERLVLDIWTNGSLSPSEAVANASKLIVRWFNLLKKVDFIPFENEEEEVLPQEVDITTLPIEELHLSVRAFNGLKKAQIHLIGDLLKYSLKDLKKIKNFGLKSVQEVIGALEKHSKALKE